MIVLSPRAVRQVRALRRHYEERGRPEATRNLVDALESAWTAIAANPDAGLPAPRPYKQLARTGRAWVQAGRYWIAYSTRLPVAIIAVFYDVADIPGRLWTARVAPPAVTTGAATFPAWASDAAPRAAHVPQP